MSNVPLLTALAQSQITTQFSPEEVAEYFRIKAEMIKDEPAVLRFWDNCNKIEKRLYKIEYGTFDEFCVATFKKTSARIRQLKGFEQKKLEMLAATGVTLPKEGVSRTLNTFPDDDQPRILRLAADAAFALEETLTSQHILSAADTLETQDLSGTADGERPANAQSLVDATIEHVYEARQLNKDIAAAKRGLIRRGTSVADMKIIDGQKFLAIAPDKFPDVKPDERVVVSVSAFRSQVEQKG